MMTYPMKKSAAQFAACEVVQVEGMDCHP